MIRTLLTLSVCLLLAVPAVNRAVADEGQGAGHQVALTAWLEHQIGVRTWSAAVTQIRELVSLTRPLSSTGWVTFSRPERFRWQLGEPARTIVVGTSEHLLIAYPRLKQLERYDYGDAIDPGLRQVIDLLEVGFPNSIESFQARYELVAASLTDATWRFRLRPRSVEARRLLEQVVLEIRAADQMLMATEFLFPDGSRMRNVFESPTLNEPVDDGLFLLQPADDWQVSEPLAN